MRQVKDLWELSRSRKFAPQLVDSRLTDNRTRSAIQYGSLDRRKTVDSGYEAYENRTYCPIEFGSVLCSWHEVVATLPLNARVLAVDGPATLNWERLVAEISVEWVKGSGALERLPMADFYLDWNEILSKTDSPELIDDPDFATIPIVELIELFNVPTLHPPELGTRIVYGPGAAFVEHDVLWYADLPKRLADCDASSHAVQNLGRPAGLGAGSTSRLQYVDWPILDRHRAAIFSRIDRWIDATDLERPTSMTGPNLRKNLGRLAHQPMRTLPTFNSDAWGGHWGQLALGHNLEKENTAVGCELIGPLSGLLLGDDAAAIEVPFALLVAAHPLEILGDAVTREFGNSLPIRFNYLDTVDGGNLSIHCHPQPKEMRETFGWLYPQHESYYVVEGDEKNRVFLGLHDDVDVEAFSREVRQASDDDGPVDVESFVQSFPALPGQLFLIPAGTIHGSGVGNVILEISATPYLYSLRFYDWQRRSETGRGRPIHAEHALRNLDRSRRGKQVIRDLVQTPHEIRSGHGWCEEVLGKLCECFYEVRRITMDNEVVVPDDTKGRFHILNVVDGHGVTIETSNGFTKNLHRAETVLIPAECGTYRLTAMGSQSARVIKALIK